MSKRIKVMSVFGTRPEAIKMAPLVLELQKHPALESSVWRASCWTTRRLMEQWRMRSTIWRQPEPLNASYRRLSIISACGAAPRVYTVKMKKSCPPSDCGHWRRRICRSAGAGISVCFRPAA